MNMNDLKNMSEDMFNDLKDGVITPKTLAPIGKYDYINLPTLAIQEIARVKAENVEFKYSNFASVSKEDFVNEAIRLLLKYGENKEGLPTAVLYLLYALERELR